MGWNIIGLRKSTFDFWSIVHFGFYSFIFSIIEAIWSPAWFVHLSIYIGMTIAWELFEVFGEKKWPEMWRGKEEHWSNRWIGDPISNGLGTLFGILIVGL